MQLLLTSAAGKGDHHEEADHDMALGTGVLQLMQLLWKVSSGSSFFAYLARVPSIIATLVLPMLLTKGHPHWKMASIGPIAIM